MLFNSLHYFIFCFITIPIFFLLNEKKQRTFLLWISVYFYACLKIIFLPILLLSFISTFYTSIKIDESKEKFKKRIWLFLSLFVNLGILLFFKYTDFLRSIYYDVIHYTGSDKIFEPYNIILPLGISFYTFQAIAYTIDIYREEIPAEKDFSRFSLFLLFFPQLVAGPIMRASVLIHQFDGRKYFSKKNLNEGLPLIAFGIFKKTIIADPISTLITPIYNNPSDYNALTILCAMMFFSIQIYCDFAGYSDIAIGTGKILGFEIPLNFKRPFLAASTTELWQRWHISLSTWLRDYVYISLGGNRGFKIQKYFNLFITMVIGGIWHGAAWTFVLWGTLNAIILTTERYFSDNNWLGPFQKIPRFIKIIFTFLVFVFSGHFFRAPNMNNALIMYSKLANISEYFQSSPILIPSILIPMFALVLYEIAEEMNMIVFIKENYYFSKLIQPVTFAIFFVSFMIYTVTSSPQFYYFQF